MKNLKTQFILSHMLPVLITIPLILIALNYAMETHYILRDMKKTIQDQSEMITQYAENNPEVWQDKSAADHMIQEIRPNLLSGVVLFDSAWNILAMADPDQPDLHDYGEISPIVGLDYGLMGFEPIVNISRYNPFRNSDDIIEMMVPVSNQQNQLLGVIRLNFPATYFEEQLKKTSGRVVLILICGILLGALFGLINAISLEKRLSRTTNAIYDLSTGVRSSPLPETGPEEIRKLSVAFNSLAEQLETSERTRTKLVSYLTHEIGRPLGAMSSAVDALHLGASQDEKLADDLTTGMKNEIKRLELLVGDLSLLREKTDPINLYIMKPVSLTPWLQEIYRYWMETARAKGVTLVESIDPVLPSVTIDENRFYQALGNLVSNAIKFSSKGNEVILKAEQDTAEIRIEVIDHGAGIKAEEIPHIFDSFYRGEENRRFVQGMGLGLTIAKDVVEAHHGAITVVSQLGVGSNFTIHLPKDN